MKLVLWIGTPSLATFLAWSYPQFLENIQLFFFLSVAALVVAILPWLSDAKIRQR